MSRALCNSITCCCIFICGALGCGGPPTPSPKTAKPNASLAQLTDIAGQQHDFWHENPSKVAVAIFTRTDCPISNRFAPEVRRLYDRYHPNGVEFYLIYVDPHERPEDIRKHLEEFKYPCKALLDPKHSFVESCHATTTPEAVVFDKNHAIVYQGRIDDTYEELGKPRSVPTTHDLADAIESTLQGRTITVPRTKPVGCLIADLKN